MVRALQRLKPASETYAGFAWTHLQRNGSYGQKFDDLFANIKNYSALFRQRTRYETEFDSQAHPWGLECFESPNQTGLEAFVIWRQSVFPGALRVKYHSADQLGDDVELFVLTEFNCQKQHYIKSDGQRITVLKSKNFWLQIAGKPQCVECENEPFSVMMDGGNGARRRIDALRQLTSLKRDGASQFKLLGRQRAFIKLINGLLAYDIKAAGGSYKDVAIALFGPKLVAKEWEPTGCFLKARAIRAFKFGERMVAQDYQSLLPKKTL